MKLILLWSTKTSWLICLSLLMLLLKNWTLNNSTTGQKKVINIILTYFNHHFSPMKGKIIIPVNINYSDIELLSLSMENHGLIKKYGKAISGSGLSILTAWDLKVVFSLTHYLKKTHLTKIWTFIILTVLTWTLHTEIIGNKKITFSQPIFILRLKSQS